MPTPRTHRLLLAAGATALSLTLSACAGEGGGTASGTATTPPTTVTTEAATATTSAPATTGATGTESAVTSASASGPAPAESTRTSRNASSGEELDEEVEAVAERFSTLAPRSFFEEFDSCNETGLEGSFECSGSKVGQFQFFDSQSKAASTTQLLTELRSSRVVEDTGRKVVGWSTLGTTAVITVVDNELGLVAQQLVSSDLEDPEQRIYELGLAEAPDTTAPTSAPTSPASSAREGSLNLSTADERQEV